MTASDVWQDMLATLETESSAISFDVWLKPLEPVDIIDGKLVLLAPSLGGREFVNTRFYPLLKSAMNKANELLTDLMIIEPMELEQYKLKEAFEIKEEEAPAKVEATVINPKYNFENFVVGKSNQFVYAAARAVSEEPGKRYNPLFIYGGVGLGKTHIMHAIGNAVRISYPHIKTLYVSSEKFVNEFIASIRATKGNSTNFRDKYRNVDILMIDDIQFIAGKESTQEEIFHTFNDLYQCNKQIILTSDRPPKEIPALEERLRSRFEWGMIADIQPPDLETRIAILQKKAQLEKHNISTEVLTFMAERIDNNIREMESLLNKVIFLSMLSEKSPSVELVKEALKDYDDRAEETLSADDIITCACKYFNVTKDDLVGKKKNREVVEPRQMCIYLITELMDLPLTSIGNIFGGRDHTTIMHARDKIAEKVNSDPKVKIKINDLRDMVFRK